MKLISLNVEGHAHLERIYPFLEHEQADVLCLQEASEKHVELLEKMGYKTAFAPRCLKKDGDKTYTDGVLFASTLPFTAETFYYHKPSDVLQHDSFDKTSNRRPNWQTFLFATVAVGTDVFSIGTTHFTWTPDGALPSKAQIDDMKSFLDLVATLPPHVMCGDFNIPRYHNFLYQDLTKIYTDDIPHTYESSLDKALHRFGENKEIAHIFSDYMVDYIFSQKPYTATDVRLEFGLSDHAAVVAEIHKE